MPDYHYPGVYVEELPAPSQPIAGVSTSTAGFIGYAGNDTPMPETPKSTPASRDYYKICPAKTPIALTSWDKFCQSFGVVATQNKFLALSVFNFFNNGGTRCYVARIADPATVTADVPICLKAFAAIDEISMVAAPLVPPPKATPPAPPKNDPANPIHTLLIDHCTKLKDRIAILDWDDSDPTDTSKLPTSSLPASADGYAALYVPWISVLDPTSATGATVHVPPSGAVAGVYARTDATRGVHKAPANEEVSGARDLAFAVGNNDQSPLNDVGVNCIRNFYGSIRVWGARTLAANVNAGGNPQWKYVNVRRFMIYLEESIQQSLRWVVFEPNDPGLWQRIKRTVNDFLLTQWRGGALFGVTPKEAFFVRCDASTNPPELRELGQVVTVIGVAIVKPAEFVVFRIQQQTGG